MLFVLKVLRSFGPLGSQFFFSTRSLGPQLNKIRSLCFIAHQAGRRQDASNLFDVFGRQLSGIGKMLMCLDKMREGSYTSRIWCIFEAWGMLLGGLAEIQEKHPKICLIMF